MKHTLYLISGPPGIGKTTIARALLAAFGGIHREADMYFVNDDGEYVWDPKQIKQAHEWCQQECREWMAAGAETIIIANTFTAQWMVEIYLDMAKTHDYDVIRVSMESPTLTHEDLAQRNVHQVPADTISRMRGRR